MVEEESWLVHHPSRWGSARQCVAFSRINWKKEGEEGDFDHGPEVVVAAWLARRRA